MGTNIFYIECWKENIDKKYFTDIINKCDINVFKKCKF